MHQGLGHPGRLEQQRPTPVSRLSTPPSSSVIETVPKLRGTSADEPLAWLSNQLGRSRWCRECADLWSGVDDAEGVQTYFDVRETPVAATRPKTSVWNGIDRSRAAHFAPRARDWCLDRRRSVRALGVCVLGCAGRACDIPLGTWVIGRG
jgi:hypothetical protein